MNKCNCNCNHCNDSEGACINTELLGFIEIIAEAKSSDRQLWKFMAVSWISTAEGILAKARGEQ